MKLWKPTIVHEVIAIVVQLDTKLRGSQSKPTALPKSQPVVSTTNPHTIPRLGNLAIKKLSLMKFKRREIKGMLVLH